MGRRKEAVAYYQNLYNPKVRYNRITGFQKDLSFSPSTEYWKGPR